MQRAIGILIGVLLIRIVLPIIFGRTGIVYFASIVISLMLIYLLFYAWDIHKLHRLRQRNCDNALLYAWKKRRAFDEPDFSHDELRDVRRAQKRGDSRAVRALIASADKRLLDEKLKVERLAAAQVRLQREVEQRRPAEIRLYRA